MEDIVSIITIVLNGEQYIEQTINSVLNQKNVKIEYIVIDGGSKDGTLQKIEKYKNSIDILISEPDNGIYDAINKGVKLANGSLIGIIHCGDFYEPDTLSLVYREFQRTSADVIYGDVKIIEPYSNYAFTHYSRANHNLLKKNFSIFHPSTFIKRDCYIRNGLYNTNYRICADYEFILQLFLKNLNFQYVPVVIANFRSGGISGTKPKLLFKENFQIRKELLGTIKALIYIITTIPIHLFFTLRKFFIEFAIGEQNFLKLRFYILNKRRSGWNNYLRKNG